MRTNTNSASSTSSGAYKSTGNQTFSPTRTNHKKSIALITNRVTRAFRPSPYQYCSPYLFTLLGIFCTLTFATGCAELRSPRNKFTFTPYVGPQEWRTDEGGFPVIVKNVSIYRSGRPLYPYIVLGKMDCVINLYLKEDSDQAIADAVIQYGGTGAVLISSALPFPQFLAVSYFVIKTK